MSQEVTVVTFVKYMTKGHSTPREVPNRDVNAATAQAPEDAWGLFFFDRIKVVVEFEGTQVEAYSSDRNGSERHYFGEQPGFTADQALSPEDPFYVDENGTLRDTFGQVVYDS